MPKVYSLDDPRPIAAAAPYTFGVPTSEELAALERGDLVKLIFRPIVGGGKWDAERMWVTITAISGEELEGRLDNQPDDIPGLSEGEIVQFSQHHVIDKIWGDKRSTAPPVLPAVRAYWDRCLVDRCVLDEAMPVHFLYREQPDMTQADDSYEDSGWRIRGDYRGLSDAEIDSREMEYIAIGKVLNVDDSWLHLIDSPIGSAFIRDWATGMFVPDKAYGSSES